MRDFRGSFLVTIIGLALAGWWGSYNSMGIFAALWLTFVLAVLEVSLSFDNAVVNAGVLKHMDAYWRRMFLTVGILIAVFGMRLVFPVVVVWLASDLALLDTLRMALNNPNEYSRVLIEAYPTIAAFGGMFLMLVFLNFIFDTERGMHWLGGFERRLASLGKLENISVMVGLGVLFALHWLVPPELEAEVMVAGLAGAMLYIGVDALSSYIGGDEGDAVATAAKRAGFGGFMYLEVLDASFSFDGVIGAFAITRDIIIIMIGLAIGAMFVRSMTVYLVNKGTLDEFVYLEHGAHYAIGALAVIMLVGIQYHVPEVITGLIGAALIGASLISSILHRRRNPEPETDTESKLESSEA